METKTTITIEHTIPDVQIKKVIDSYIDAAEEEILLADDAAKFLGICINTLHKKSNKGMIKYYSFKGIRPKLFLKSDLKKYLKAAITETRNLE